MPAETSLQMWKLRSPIARREGLRSSSKQEGRADGRESQAGGLRGIGCCGYLVGEEAGVRVGEEVASDRKAK